MNATSGAEKAFIFDVVSKVYLATDSNPVDLSSYELCSDMIEVVSEISMIYGGANISSPTDSVQSEGTSPSGSLSADQNSVLMNASNPKAAGSTIKLNNGMVLYMREIHSNLALVCLLRKEHFAKQGLLDYNVDRFRSAFFEVFEKR